MTRLGRVAVIGAGAMGGALIRGTLARGLVRPEDVIAADPDARRLEALAAGSGVATTEDNGAAVRFADVVLLAVKPQLVAPVLEACRDSFRPSHTVISIAAGVTLASIEAKLPAGIAAVRVMPNTPCLVGAGASAMALGRHAGPEHAERARALLEAVGTVELLPEPLLDAVTGLSGSGPAYGYLMIEALADGGVTAGLPRDVALRLAAQTLLGAAKMVLETGQHPGALKDLVMSPGGTTAAGVRALEARGMRSALIEAVVSASERSRELGAKRS